MKFKNRKLSAGYTLVEILVVAAIIAIVLGISATTMRNLTQSKGVQAGVPLVKGVFEEARQLSTGTGAPVRVVVYVDGENALSSTADDLSVNEKMDKVFKFIGIAQYFENEAAALPYTTFTGDGWDETPGVWKLRGKGLQLPPGCFFDTNLCLNQPGTTGNYATYSESVKGDEAALVANGLCNVFLPGWGTMNDVECFFYEYNGLGIITNPQTQSSLDASYNKAPRVILRSGKLRRAGTAITIADAGDERLYRGFFLARSGETIEIQNLDDVADAAQ